MAEWSLLELKDESIAFYPKFSYRKGLTKMKKKRHEWATCIKIEREERA